jgi:hypothetical protein
LALLALGAVALLAGPAQAATQIGQISPGEPEACTVGNIPQLATGTAPSYTVPSDGVITEWSHRGLAASPGSGGLQVWRSAGGSDYTLVGKSAIKTFAAGENSYPVNQPVKAGDVIGLRIASDGTGCYFTGGAGDVAGNGPPGVTQPDVEPGETQAFAYPANGVRANISAVFTDNVPPDTSVNYYLADLSGVGLGDHVPTLEFYSSETGSSFECKPLNKEGDPPRSRWGGCSSPESFPSPPEYSSLPDGNYTFSVRATDPAGNTDPSPAIRFFELDTPTFSVGDVTVAEGNSGKTDATFSVHLDEPIPQTVTVSFATLSGTARAGEDYYYAEGTLIFQPGISRRTFSVQIKGDTEEEPTERIVVELFNPSPEAWLTRTGSSRFRSLPSGTITIVDDDATAKIKKVKVGGPGKVKKGKKATYKVKITNSGNVKATGVRLKVSGRGVGFNTSVGKIAAGKTRTVKLKVKPKKTGKVKLQFKVTSKNAGGKTAKKKVKVKK